MLALRGHPLRCHLGEELLVGRFGFFGHFVGVPGVDAGVSFLRGFAVCGQEHRAVGIGVSLVKALTAAHVTGLVEGALDDLELSVCEEVFVARRHGRSGGVEPLDEVHMSVIVGVLGLLVLELLQLLLQAPVLL